MNSEYIDPELVILENIYDSSHGPTPPRQRDLATVAGASLGMTNSILKRLAQKGLITVQRLNSRNVRYAVTPDGVNEIARRSYRYFKRTIRNVVFYRDQVDQAVADAKLRGMESVLLVGVSDLDFIVEHSCSRHGLSFLKAVDAATAASLKGTSCFTVFAESLQPPTAQAPRTRSAGSEAAGDLYLSRMLSGAGNQ